MPTTSTPVIDYAAMQTLTAQFQQSDTNTLFQYSAFSVNISDIIKQVTTAFPNNALVAGVLVCVDTLFMDVSTVTLNTTGFIFVARSVQVTTTGPCNVQVPYEGLIVFLTQEIVGSASLTGQITGASKAPVPISVPPTFSALNPTPYLLLLNSGQPNELQASNQPSDVASNLDSEFVFNALNASFVGASSLLYGNSDQQFQAHRMLDWVKTCCTDLIPPISNSLSGSDLTDITDLQGQSVALLTILRYQAGSVYYVPILSSSFYMDQLNGLLSAAQAYDTALTTLKNTTTLQDTLKQLAATQQAISKDAETPLTNSLIQLVEQAQDYRRQYVTTMQLYQIQLQTVQSTRQAYEDEMEKYSVFSALQFAFTILETAASIAALAGGCFVDDPAQSLDVDNILLGSTTGDAIAFIEADSHNFATDIPLKTLASGGFQMIAAIQQGASMFQLFVSIAQMLPTGDLIQNGNWTPAPINLPTQGITSGLLLTADPTKNPDYVPTLEQNKFPAGLINDFKVQGGIVLPSDTSKITVAMTTGQNNGPLAKGQTLEYWNITDTTTSNKYLIWPVYTKQNDGSYQITQLQVYDGTALDKLMYDLQTIDLTNPLVPINVPSIEGQDPVTYWNNYRINAEGSLQPYASSIPGVAPYLTAIQQLSEYGKALASQQKELMRLHGEALDVIARLNALNQAQQKWQELIDAIASDDQKRAQAESLLLKGYTDLKRSMFVAVQNYRNAYRYNWLTEPPLQITMDMNYTALQTQCSLASEGLEKVLQTTANGVVQPASQDFIIPVEVDIPLGKPGDNSGLPYFDSTGTLTWTIKGPDTPDVSSSDPPAVTQQLPGLKAIYITSAMFYLDGIKPDPITNEVWVNVHTSGTYFHRLGTSGFFNFASPEFGMDCSYKLDSNNTPQPDTYWKPSTDIENLYMKASPYTTWTLKVTDGDYSNVTKIRMQFTGFYLHDTTPEKVTQ